MRDVTRGLPVDATPEESAAYYAMRADQDAAKQAAQAEAEQATRDRLMAEAQGYGATLGTTAASRGET
jgi:hypothetical protein